MPLPRFEKLPPEKRRAILEAAAEEFAEHGFEGASFNRIIAAAGISKGAMYYYFADKADAYGAVLDDAQDRMLASLAGLPAPTDAESYWGVMALGLARLDAFFFAEPRLAALARGLYRGGGAEPIYQRQVARSHGWVAPLLDLGRRLGAVRSDVPSDLLTELAMGMLIAADRWFVEASAHQPQEELQALSTIVLGMLRSALAPASASR